mmetsp:Transcript_132411/g.423787  ORF Transcript_132411/g.423787 Transcript_132411/m.423787 type:complete len:233 (+) Transcript_132411:210-908(+)
MVFVAAAERASAAVVAKAMNPKLYDAHSLAQASLHTLATTMLYSAAAATAEAAVQNGDSYVGLLVVGPATGVNELASIKKDVLPAMRSVAALPIRLLFQTCPPTTFAFCLPRLPNLMMEKTFGLRPRRASRPSGSQTPSPCTSSCPSRLCTGCSSCPGAPTRQRSEAPSRMSLCSPRRWQSFALWLMRSCKVSSRRAWLSCAPVGRWLPPLMVRRPMCHTSSRAPIFWQRRP